jgi:hypothetical protein
MAPDGLSVNLVCYAVVMHILLLVLILLFGSSSYVAGILQILRNRYKPNVFSRIVWLVLAGNSYAALIASHSSSSSKLLSLIFLIGNAAICLLSFWKGTRTLGKLEYICLALLVISGLVWIVFDAPLINLGIGLAAHFIGALPTYKRVWKNGSTESAAFWSLFCIASVLSLFDGNGAAIKDVLFPIYFTLFDGSMTVLSLRKSTKLVSE